MLRSNKPNRCKHCKKRMPEDKARHILHDECKDAWIAEFRKKQEQAKASEKRKKERVEKAEHRKAKEKAKTPGKRRAEAQSALNSWVVHGRDKDQPCISCGRHHQGEYHGGHYRSRGSAAHLALEPRNVHKQCAPCNTHLHGNLIEYRKGLIARYGVEFVEALEEDDEPRHYSPQDLDAIKVDYRAKLKELKGRA